MKSKHQTPNTKKNMLFHSLKIYKKNTQPQKVWLDVFTDREMSMSFIFPWALQPFRCLKDRPERLRAKGTRGLIR